MKNIYIITGHNRVGKSTLAHMLRHEICLNQNLEHLQRAKVFPFGEELKNELTEIGFTRPYIDKKSPKARRLMRAYGDAVRETEPLHFVRRWRQSVEDWLLESEDTQMPASVISDDVYHHAELVNMLTLGVEHGRSAHIIVCLRPGFVPTASEIEDYDSVREAVQIHDLFNLPNPDSEQKVYVGDEVLNESEARMHYSTPVVAVIKSAKVVFVYNTFKDTESYREHLFEDIIPNLI